MWYLELHFCGLDGLDLMVVLHLVRTLELYRRAYQRIWPLVLVELWGLYLNILQRPGRSEMLGDSRSLDFVMALWRALWLSLRLLAT
jgi:hypothetical protein